MSKEIVIVIKGDKMIVDFDGFPGDKCFDMMKRLTKKCKELGLQLEVKKTEKKPPIPEDASREGLRNPNAN